VRAERILQHALERPWQWMPVLAMLIKRFPASLPAAALELWLAKVRASFLTRACWVTLRALTG
jgi:hypothetical protein